MVVLQGEEPPLYQWYEPLASVPGARLFAAVLIVVAGVYLSKLLVRLLGRPIARRFARQSVAQTFLRGIRVGTVILALVTALWISGVDLPDVLLAGAVFSAVVGVILAPLIGNFINGVFVLADQPFEIGDMIELEDGTQGFVDDITIRYTKIFTLDNTFLVVPNGNMRNRDVTNYSAEDERTRRSLDLLVTYESDIKEARRIMERAARSSDAVVDGGPDIRIGVARYSASPDCRVHEFGDDGVLLRLRYWVKKPYKLLKVQSEVNARIRELATEADVEMAYPHRHIVFDDTSGTANVDLGQRSEPPDPDAPDDADAADGDETADTPEVPPPADSTTNDSS